MKGQSPAIVLVNAVQKSRSDRSNISAVIKQEGNEMKRSVPYTWEALSAITLL
jgi:hypothetical protein